jgi:hypothetical protein
MFQGLAVHSSTIAPAVYTRIKVLKPNEAPGRMDVPGFGQGRRDSLETHPR